MRPLFLIFVLALALPAAADPITTAESEKVAIAHFLSHEAGQRLIIYSSDLPVNDADATRIGQARVAIYEVEAGCEAPCEDSAKILLYSGKIDYAAANLKMKPEQVKAAKDRYLPQGIPRPRQPGRRYNSDPKLADLVERRVLEAQLKLPQTVKDREALSARSKAMAAALGRTLGPGDGGAGASAVDALVKASPVGTAEQARQALAQFESQRAAQSEMYRMKPTDVPAPVADGAANAKLERAIVKAQRNFADDVPAQQAIRYLLTDADQKLKKGYKPDGPLFERLFPVAGYETKLNLIASDTMKSNRGDYGGGGSAGLSASMRFVQESGVELSDTQLADVDHFFYASGTGAAGAPGAVACVGMSAIWDGALPVVQYAYGVAKSAGIYGYNAAKGMATGTGDQELEDRARLSRATSTAGLAYNAKQLKTDVKGCAHGMVSR